MNENIKKGIFKAFTFGIFDINTFIFFSLDNNIQTYNHVRQFTRPVDDSRLEKSSIYQSWGIWGVIIK